MAHPNVLLITADHLRSDALSCYGNEFVHTPNVERLARRGVVFSNWFTPNPICVPARASITTGNYSHRATGCKDNSGLITADQPRIAEHFAQNNYQTFAIGKLHYTPYEPPEKPRRLHGFGYAELCEEGRMIAEFDPTGLRRGVEDYHDFLHAQGWGGYERAHGVGNNDVRPAPSAVPADFYVDAWVVQRSIATIRRHIREVRGRNEAPFFMWTSFPKPHAPYDPPEPYHRRYDPRRLPAPIGTPDLLKTRNPQLAPLRFVHGWDKLSPEAIQLARAHYFGQVTFQDEMLGWMLDFLEEEGLQENTIVIYTADHGDLLGDFGCFFKNNFLNGSVRVPGIFSAPGLFAGNRVTPELAGLQDILPTVATLARVPLDQSVHGVDLSPVLLEGISAPRDVFVSQNQGAGRQGYMLCSQGTKYIYSEMNATEEFYDLTNDPCELHNLAPDMADSELVPWRDRLIAWCREYGDCGMLDGHRLVCTECELDPHPSFRSAAMGWRWY